MKEPIKRLSIELEEDIFYALKSFCVKNKITIKNFITNLIKEKID